MAGKMTIDDLLGQMPKMMGIADDLHAMTGYINDLRIVAIVMSVTGFIGGIAFLIFKYIQMKNGDDYDEEDSITRAKKIKNKPYYDDNIHGWELQAVNSDGEKHPPPPSLISGQIRHTPSTQSPTKSPPPTSASPPHDSDPELNVKYPALDGSKDA